MQAAKDRGFQRAMHSARNRNLGSTRRAPHQRCANIFDEVGHFCTAAVDYRRSGVATRQMAAGFARVGRAWHKRADALRTART
jgi:hypothetical protein